MKRKDRKGVVQTGQTQNHDKPPREHTDNSEVKVSGSIQVFEPESVSNQRSAERKTNNRYKHFTKIHENRTHVTAVVMIVLTAAYFVVTAGIFMQSRRATDIAHDSLVATQRPWISAEVALIGPFSMDATYVSLPTRISLENVGASTAVNVQIEDDFTPNPPFDLIHAREKLADQVRGHVKANPNQGEAIFAKQKTFYRDIVITMLRSDYDRAIKNHRPNPPIEGVNLILPTVIFCVGYQSSLDKDPHITALTLHIMKKDRQLGRDLARFPDDISTVSFGDLVLYSGFINATYAD